MVAAEGSAEGVIGEEGEDGTRCIYLTQQDGEVLTIGSPSQLTQLLPDHVSHIYIKNLHI